MNNTEEKTDFTGLANVPEAERPLEEKDLLTALLAAAEFKDSEEAKEEIKIKRKGKFLFSFHIHPLTTEEIQKARKRATKYAPNPRGKKFPLIEKERDTGKFYSLLIYQATTAEDRGEIWGNQVIMEKYDLVEEYETIDILLLPGEKELIVGQITDISGYGEDDEEDNGPDTLEEYAKN